MPEKNILRVIDVNFNRAKEGLRVVEDLARFVFENDPLRRQARRLRHNLDSLAREKSLKTAVLSRDSRNDLGREVDNWEIKRKNVEQLLYVNIQRVKESLRVLEETFKIVNPRRVPLLKKMRYRVYNLEKKALCLKKVS
jgi:thiamine-phosphate pyrophosphorylase